MRDSVGTANLNAGINVIAGAAAILFSILDNVGTIGNGTGLSADGSSARVFLTRFTAVGNNVGISATNSGQIVSYLYNHLNGNISSNGAPTSTQTPQ